MTMRTAVLLIMSPKARRALARRWFLDGFAASGIGFNGETFDREKYPAVESILIAHFEAIYDRLNPGNKRG